MSSKFVIKQFKNISQKLARFISYVITHGVISTIFRLFGQKNKYLYHGNIGGDIGFSRIAEQNVFNTVFSNGKHSGFQHVHPNVFRDLGKQIYFVSDIESKPKLLSDAIHLKSILSLTSDEISKSVFYLYFTFDSDALPQIRKILKHNGTLIPHMDPSKTLYRFIDKQCFQALANTWEKEDRVSHLNYAVHENICEALRITVGLTGDYLEIGVYKGGTMLTAVNYLSEISQLGMPKRKVIGLDTFEGFNYEQAKLSGDKIWYGTHELYGKSETMTYVKNTLENAIIDYEIYSVNICSDSIPNVKSISVAYVDVDMYEATRDSLIAVHPLLQDGGIIICEDPASTPALYGSYLAMEEFLESSNGSLYTKIFKGGTYFLLKNK